jgi:predicted Zn-dependent peptidase
MTTLTRDKQPSAEPLGKITIAEPEKYSLSNGIPVYQFNSGTQELVMIELIFDAGSWYQQHPFTATGTNLMLREGTEKLTSAQISEKLDFHGAHLETSVEKDHAFVTLFTLNKHLYETLPVLEDIVKHASYPEDECSVISLKQKQQLTVNLQKVNYLARTRFTSLLFGNNHPYGHFLEPVDLDHVTTGQFRNFHRDFYHAGNCRIMVAGKVPEFLPQMLQASFGGNDWLGLSVKSREYLPEPSRQKELIIPKDDALQSAIRMGRQMFNRSHPDFEGLHFLNTLLGGYFGSRLMSNLREDKGYTYGVGSAIIPLKHSGYFFISAEVGSDVTRDAISEIKTELSRLCDDLVPDEELSLVRNYLQGAFLRSIDGPFALAEKYKEIMLEGFDTDSFHEMLDIHQSITAIQLRNLAQKYFNPEEMYCLIAGRQP